MNGKLTAALMVAAIPLSGMTLAALARPLSRPGDSDELMQRRGVVSAYRLDADGTVYVRVRVSGPQGDRDQSGSSESEGSPQELWFRSPADRSSVISVEEMLLAVVLDVGRDEPLTFSAEPDRTLDGSTPEAAYPIVRVTRP